MLAKPVPSDAPLRSRYSVAERVLLLTSPAIGTKRDSENTIFFFCGILSPTGLNPVGQTANKFAPSLVASYGLLAKNLPLATFLNASTPRGEISVPVQVRPSAPKR